MSSADSDALTFEKGRIQALRQERVSVQQKTFTKWVNSYLGKVNCHIDDVFKDFEDGRLLLKLLELISGEKMGRAKPAKLRVQKVENVNKALQFLSTKVRLESIGPEDIVDGNPRLILGLMWTIILRFEIQEIKIEGIDSAETRSAKEALLLWCQRQTANYNDVNIRNFSSSWRSGSALCALIHTHRPDLIDYSRLQNMTNIERLNTAFDAAHEHLGISPLLDAEDVDIDRPDEKSIITYVSAYYHYFAKMKSGETGKKRIVKILSKLQELQEMISNYEHLVTDLLVWIKTNTKELSSHNFPNSLEGIKTEMTNFKLFRTREKPPKYKVWTNIEAIWFEIQSKVRDSRCRPYTPPEDGSIHDIARAWQELERGEYLREIAIREELIRLEKLHRLAETFERKALLRESWIADISTVLEQSVIPNGDVKLLEACIKRHEAITADIMARQGRFEALSQMAKELISQNYEDSSVISQRDKDISKKWQELMDLLSTRQQALEGLSDLIGLLREIDAVGAEMEAMEVSLQSTDYGKHLLAVEGLLERHSLTEVQFKDQESQISHIRQEADSFREVEHRESEMIKKKIDKLKEIYQRIEKLRAHRRKHLEASLNYFQFLQEEDEIDSWITEKERLARSKVTGRDIRNVLHLRQKHCILETEVQGGDAMVTSITEMGDRLIGSGHPSQRKIRAKLQVLQSKMGTLKGHCEGRRHRLEEALETHQFFIDVNEVDSWLREKMPIVCSDDYGSDSTSAQLLMQRHHALDEEIQAHENDVRKLADQAQSLVTKYQQPQKVEGNPAAQHEDDENDGALPPSTGSEDEGLRVVGVEEDVIEEKEYPQVKALYKYEAYGMKIPRGEVMLLASKSNADWWEVRCSSGQQGFIPANYVKEVAPKVIRRKIRKKKAVTPDENGNDEERRGSRPSTKGVRAKDKSLVDRESIMTRQKGIEGTYVRLKKLARARKMYLTDSIKLFTFYRECDEFEDWMSAKERVMSRKEGLSDNVDAARRHFENLVIDLQANQGRFERINKMADDFVTKGHSKQVEARQRQREINGRWGGIWSMRENMQKMMEGASSIELYNQSWGEAKEWIAEKVTAVAENYLTSGAPSEEYIQRKMENIGQELTPVKENLRKLGILATAVKSSYPTEVGHIKECETEIRDRWRTLEQQLRDKRAELVQARDQAMFASETKQLMNWTVDVRSQLLDTQTAKDVQGCEDMMSQHLELLAEIEANKQRFDEALALAERIPDGDRLQGKMQMLLEVPSRLLDDWDKRNRQLENATDLAMFNKEADQIDADSLCHEAFLEYDELGSSVREIETLKKRHDSFLASLEIQEEKLSALREMSGNLIQKGHSSQNYVKGRVDSVIERRTAVKDKAEERSKLINCRREFLYFKREAEEMALWIAEKVLIAEDDSYKDLSCLPRKLKKHQEFEAELTSHRTVIEQLREDGRKLIDVKNPSSDDIEDLLGTIQSSWGQLRVLTDEKGANVRQASQQVEHNRGLEDISMSLEEVTAQLKSEEVGDSSKSVRNFIKRHESLKKNLASAGEKMRLLKVNADSYRQDGHYNSGRITMDTEALSSRFEAIIQPIKEREMLLQEALRGQEFKLRVDSKLQWISERLPAVQSIELGRDYHTAQVLVKKCEKLKSELAHHDSLLQGVLEEGRCLIIGEHSASLDIRDSCDRLRNAWQELHKLHGCRQELVEKSFKVQQYLVDATEVDLWFSQRLDENIGQNLGKDETATSKLLAKTKALEEDLRCQEEIIDGLQQRVHEIIQKDYPGAVTVAEKQGSLDRQLIKVANRVSDWRGQLELAQLAHRYTRDSDEFGHWIEEQYQLAASEEYGQDYEHMQMLWDKFVVIKGHVEGGCDMYKSCEEQAGALLDRVHMEGDEIREKQKSLKQAFGMLMEQVATREDRLQAAGEMHQFRCMYDDVISRIQEKPSLLPEEHGKGVDSVQSLIRKHGTFTTDMVAVNSQLGTLLDRATELNDAYPKMFLQELSEMREAAIIQWEKLKQRSEERGMMLQTALDYHTFLASYRELKEWSLEIETAMSVTDTIQSIAGAVDALQNHEELTVEISAREDSFTSLMEAGNILIEQQHYEQLAERLETIPRIREELLTHWESKKAELVQVHAEHVLMRDIEQLHTVSSQQEVFIANADFGESVEQVEKSMRKQEAFEKLLAVQEEKLSAVIQQQESLSPREQVKMNLAEVVKRRSDIKEHSNQRKNQLNQAKLYAQYRENVTEAEILITEKEKVLESYGSFESSSLQERLKKLKKHQAYEAELMANVALVGNIKEAAEQLVAMSHTSSSDIENEVSDLAFKWTSLRNLSRRKGQSLQQLQKLLEFQRQTERIDRWIREKTALVAFGDVGDDYEHCLELQGQLYDFGQDKSVDDHTVHALRDLADDIDQEGPEELAEGVLMEAGGIKDRWQALQGDLSDYKERLEQALEIHSFNREIQDIQERITEKERCLQCYEVGTTLEAIDLQKRRYENTLKDMGALQETIMNISGTGRMLAERFPDHHETISSSVLGVTSQWERLQASSENRQLKLEESHGLCVFMRDFRNLVDWSECIISTISSTPLVGNLKDAEKMCEKHQRQLDDIERRGQKSLELGVAGQRMIDERHPSSAEVSDALSIFEKAREKVMESWRERRRILDQCYDLQVFQEHVSTAESILQNIEAFLAVKDVLGDLCTAEADLKKQEDFEKMLEPQLDKLEEVRAVGSSLVEQDHYHKESIQATCEEIAGRKSTLFAEMEARKSLLQDSISIHLFIQNIHEFTTWIEERAHLIKEQSLEDQTNLQRKVTRHHNQEMEVLARRSRLLELQEEGQCMMKTSHPGCDEIEGALDRMNESWEVLCTTVTIRGRKLQEALQLMNFERNLTGLEHWLDRTKQQLPSLEYGKDLKSAGCLMQKHKIVENQLNLYKEKLDQASKTHSELESDDPVIVEKMGERISTSQKIHDEICHLAKRRRATLQDSVSFYQLLHDMREEMVWIEERLLSTQSTEYGKDVNTASSLCKKHKALLQDITAHEPLIKDIVSKASNMIDQSHYAASEISSYQETLNKKWKTLAEAAQKRNRLLQMSHRLKLYFSEGVAALSWLDQRRPSWGDERTPAEEERVLSLLKRLTSLQLDLDVFNKDTLDKLRTQSKVLCTDQPKEAEAVKEVQGKIEVAFIELQNYRKEMQSDLLEQQAVFNFRHEAVGIIEWIQEKMEPATSKNYGEDLDHVEILRGRFSDLVAELRAYEGEIHKLLETGQELIDGDIGAVDEIADQCHQVDLQWRGLREAANCRSEALMRSRQLHAFISEVQDTVSWIQEKNTALALVVDEIGMDLTTVQALMRKHDVLEHDLIAVEGKVNKIASEAGDLVDKFPDAFEQVSDHNNRIVESWDSLLEKSLVRKNKLQEAEKLQLYLKGYRDLSAWIHDISSLIDPGDIPNQLSEVEELLKKHSKQRSEMEAWSSNITEFTAGSRGLMGEHPPLGGEITARVEDLNTQWENLLMRWTEQQATLQERQDKLMLMRDLDQAEEWLETEGCPLLGEEHVDESCDIDELLKKQDELEQLLAQQEERFLSLNKIPED